MAFTPEQVTQITNAAAQGAASVGYGSGAERVTWGQMMPRILKASEAAAAAGVKSEAQFAALAAAISQLAALVNALSDDDSEPIDVAPILDAIREAGEQAVTEAAGVLRRALDGATVTLDTIPDEPEDPEPTQ